jgi:hypothetical protein
MVRCRMARPRRLAALALAGSVLATALIAGCGGDDDPSDRQPVIGRKGKEEQAARSLGFPTFGTKNTTRVGGADPIADAAGVAQAVFGQQRAASGRPGAIALVDVSDWQGGIAASVFMSPPVRAPILLAEGNELPGASEGTLGALDPVGVRRLSNARVIRVGDVARPGGYRTTDAGGKSPYARAAAVDRLRTKAAGRSSDRVVIASGERAEFAMPAAGWAAKSGDPVLFVRRDSIPSETMKALQTHRQPKIYILGPAGVISAKVEQSLKRLGTVRRVQGRDAVTNAIEFARYSDDEFGWGVVDPGHGLVFASANRPLDAAAAAPLAATGKYAPLLLVDTASRLPAALVQYLLDIQPGYYPNDSEPSRRDPVRQAYGHGWLMGDTSAISVREQARIDALLELVPVAATPGAPQRP